MNVKQYGAIGDWASHPISDFFNTLEDAQKTYPNAKTLNDEIDSLAIELAVKNEYDVIIPYGGYKLDRTINIKQNQRIRGSGKNVTQIEYVLDTGCAFYLEHHNTIVQDFKLYTDFDTNEYGSSNESVVGFQFNESTNIILSELNVVGFNSGFAFNPNSWCISLHNITILRCNTGVIGNGEFNNIVFNNGQITYCNTAYYVGGGRNNVIKNSDIERNIIGIVKTNNGDISISDNYFELNRDSTVDIRWGQKPVDNVIIENNSFYTDTAGEIFIKYHGKETTNVVVSGNTFDSYSIQKPYKARVFAKNDANTTCKPKVYNNYYQDDITFGIDIDKDTTNNTTVSDSEIINEIKVNEIPLYSKTNDLSKIMDNENTFIITDFHSNGVITLPDFSKIENSDITRFKILCISRDASEDDFMIIDSSNSYQTGISKIMPNTEYNIYCNNVIDNKQQVILSK